MKVNTDRIENAESIAEPVKGGGTRGLTYETLADWTGVDHLDRLDQENAVVLRHGKDGAQTLESRPLP